MNARRPKPSALKERTSVRPNLGLSRLFASANALIPLEPVQPEPRLQDDEENYGRAEKVEVTKRQSRVELLLPEEDRTLKLDDPRLTQDQKTRAKKARAQNHTDFGTAVIVPNRTKKSAVPEGTVTQPITAAQRDKAVPQRTSVAKFKVRDAEKFETRFKQLALALLIPGLAFVSYEVLSPAGPHAKPAARQSALTPTEIQERLKYYQTTLGERLNRQRIGVQIDNFQLAPALTAADHKVKPPSMLDGVPLEGEANNFQRPKDLPYDPTYSEAKIAYGLQEEQERRAFEQQAEREWVREFVENARKDGVQVEIDEQGRVKATKIGESALGDDNDSNPPVYQGSGGGAQ